MSIITISDERIVTYFDNNPSLNIEKVMNMVIDMLENINNDFTESLSAKMISNIANQVKMLDSKINNAGPVMNMMVAIINRGSIIILCINQTRSPEPLICNRPNMAAAVPALSPNGSKAFPAAAPKIEAKPTEDTKIGAIK